MQLLRCPGMNIDQLYKVVHALIVSHIRYASAAWAGFLTVDCSNGKVCLRHYYDVVFEGVNISYFRDP